MSKAFTREEDDLPEPPVPRRPPLPPGVKNLMTETGAKRLREERDRLVTTERPRALRAAERENDRRELRRIDQRIALLEEILGGAVVVPPPAGYETKVRFGAQVTVRYKNGEQATYRIVGMDETELGENFISWRSPLARALLQRTVGDRVTLDLPEGKEEVEILALGSPAETS